MQTDIVRAALEQLVAIQTPGTIVPLPYEYIAKV
ncbi:MAG: D-proline reductase (dithiol) protein PrdB, partial [Eubacteriales bacterium]|nr:D-proline reductase (dithiol) protein PrdB [Eubacteriales bacterium]